MPKSGQSRRKHVARSKRKSTRHNLRTAAQSTAIPVEEAISPAKAPAGTPRPAATLRTPKTAPAIAQSIQVSRELRRIGILAAVILVILVVLSRLLG